MSENELHLDRARAESFGSIAQQYERYRPTYPDALLDDLAALNPLQVLDVGCGTGKAAVAMARRGLSVLGIEVHWIDPDLGTAKTATLLRPGGTIARFWTSCVVDEPVIAAFDAVYRRYAPEITQVWRPTGSVPGAGADPFAAKSEFSSLTARTYHSERTLSADEWVGLAATISDHRRLGVERLTGLLQALHAVIESLGGTIHTHDETRVLLARRRS